jgi:hypothetical protein
MPKQNVSANTRRRRVTFAKKISTEALMTELASRAFGASFLNPKVKRKLKGILKKSSYKNKTVSKKHAAVEKKSVRYVLD